MSTKPTMFALAGDAKQFVFSNGDYLKKTLLVFFPLIVVLAALAAAGKEFEWPYINYAIIVPYFVVYGCYVLSWHRTSLIADGTPHVVTPFRFGRGDAKFLGFFILMSLALSGAIFAADWLARSYAVSEKITNEDPRANLLFAATLVLDLAAVYVFMRVSFILPAQSVGHTLTFKEVMTASRGLVWRLIGADFIFFILLALLLTVYSAVALEIVNMAVAGAEGMAAWQVITLSVLVSMPIQMMFLVTMALMTTALSKAYRWGVENNSAV